MVKDLKFDGISFESSDDIHMYLKDALGFPSYYGRNLNALADCLRDLPPCTIIASYSGYEVCKPEPAKPEDGSKKNRYDAHRDILDILNVMADATAYLDSLKLTVNNQIM